MQWESILAVIVHYFYGDELLEGRKALGQTLSDWSLFNGTLLMAQVK